MKDTELKMEYRLVRLFDHYYSLLYRVKPRSFFDWLFHSHCKWEKFYIFHEPFGKRFDGSEYWDDIFIEVSDGKDAMDKLAELYRKCPLLNDFVENYISVNNRKMCNYYKEQAEYYARQPKLNNEYK